MKIWMRFALIVVLATAIAGCGQEQSTTTTSDVDLSAALPMDPNVRTGKLENGLTYYIKANEKPEDRAELRLAVNAGSILEDEQQLGLAHFAEHMLFNGTENFEKNELIDFFELTGQKFGAHVNAYTSFDETVYMLKPRTDSQEVFDMGFQVLEDWAHQALFEEEEIDKERGVVIEEWRLRLGPENRMLYQYLPVLFNNSRYAERLPIGKVEVLQEFEYETIRRFYRDWYRPNLMAVVAVGDFDVDEVEQKIKDHFGDIKNPENAPEREVYDIPDHEETLVKVVTDPEASFTNINVYTKHDKKVMETVGDYRNYLMNRLISTMLSQRYEELLQQENPPFVNASSYYGGMSRTKDAYTSYAMANEGEVIRGLEAVLTENQRMLQHGFTEGELKRAKESVLKDIENRYNERDKIQSRSHARELVSNFLEKEPVPGIEFEYEMAQQLVPDIALEEVNKKPQKWMTDSNTVIIVTGPEKEGLEMPTEEEVLATYQEVKGKETEPYVDDFQEQELLVNTPTSGSIVEESSIEELGVTELTFDNGAKVVLKPTDFKNDEILISAYSFGGSSLYPDEDYYTASMVSQVVMESGIGEFSKTDLNKALSGKSVEVYPMVDNLTEGLQGNTTPEDFETYLQLQYLYFTEPRKDPTSFASFKQQQKMIYKNLDANPQFYFMKRYMKTLYDNHPRAKVPEAEDFDKIDLDRLFEIYNERFGNAGDFTFFIVGNFDVEEIKPMLATYIGGLPGEESRETFEDVGIRYPESAKNEIIRKGTEPKSMVTMSYTGDFDWSYENRFKIRALADVLRIKLRESMREDKGGVYGVGVNAQPGHYPIEDYLFSIQWGCSPENVEELIETAKGEMETLMAEGATDKDLKKVKETMLRSRETDMKENRFWTSALQQYYKHGEDPARLLEFEEHVNNLSSDDIKAAANLYFNDDRLIQFVMYPEDQEELLN